MPQFAFVAYPGFTALDMIGPYEVLRNLPTPRCVLSGMIPDRSPPTRGAGARRHAFAG